MSSFLTRFAGCWRWATERLAVEARHHPRIHFGRLHCRVHPYFMYYGEHETGQRAGFLPVVTPSDLFQYAIDSYKPIAGQIMVISTVCKNTFGVS